MAYIDRLVCEWSDEDCSKEATKVVNEKPNYYDGDHKYYCSEHAEIVAKIRGVTADDL